jgi:hypothetical protein
MAENFFLDNLDLQFRLERLDLRDVVNIKEKGYSTVNRYAAAPRNYEDAKDNYRLLLEVLGDICASVVAPTQPKRMKKEHNSITERLNTLRLHRKPSGTEAGRLDGCHASLGIWRSEHARDALPDDGGDYFTGGSRPDDDFWFAGDCLHNQ